MTPLFLDGFGQLRVAWGMPRKYYSYIRQSNM